MRSMYFGCLSLVSAVIGCGGAPTETVFSEKVVNGPGGDTSLAGGDSAGSAGATSVSSSSDVGGSGSDGVVEESGGNAGSSSSGGECIPSVSCQSVGAECGTILDNGCGKTIDCPNNCTGFLICGGNGNQFKCGCKPKTCLDMGYNCDIAEDGCGGKINCGDCTKDGEKCKGSVPNTNGTMTPGTANVCGGGCTKKISSYDNCDNTNKTAYICTPNTPIPNNTCKAADMKIYNTLEEWCCDN